MQRLPRDLAEIVAALERRSGELRVAGQAFACAPGERSPDACRRLAELLYQRFYCRPERGAAPNPPGSRAERVLIDELSQANCGQGTWQPGWQVERVEPDGSLAIHRSGDDLTLWTRPELFDTSTGRLRVLKELRAALPGYYLALGDVALDASAGLVRCYWHLTAAGAVPWMHEITTRFNAAGLAFHAKARSDPAGYTRADSGVLYLSRPRLGGAIELVREVHARIAGLLRASTPMFTRRVARGLALADDPGEGESFGQHRCALVADALLAAASRRGSCGRAIVARFARAELDVARPWLGPGARDYRLGRPRGEACAS
ncbi:MAG TPA: T3SS effector HopA1 family protein [Kofleriaceae bacterium]|nr:T3SS effector HopA1 family protein [Kofleriaceae bacterium]